MKKWAKVLGFSFLILVVVCLIAKDILIKNFAPPLVSKILGAPVTLGSFSWNPFTSHLIIKDLIIGSPQDFEKDDMFYFSRIEIRYDLSSILSGRNHFKLIDIDIRQIILAKNTTGKINVRELKSLKEDLDKNPSENKKVLLSIDELKINVDHFEIKNYAGQHIKREIYNLGMQHTRYVNITSIEDLIIKVVRSKASVLAVTNTVFLASHQLKKGVGLIFDTTENVVAVTEGLLKTITQPLRK